jgi:hypothetical protein
VLAVRVVVAIAGAVVVVATLASALQTVVVPRAKVARDRVFSVYAPLALVTLPFAG